jgi:hypothetical protein
MKTSDVVHVDLRQLGHLAVRLRRAAATLTDMADRLGIQGAGLGLAPAPRRRLREAAAWADDQHRLVGALLAELRRLERSGALPLGFSVTRRRHGAFADPTEAHAAATEAIGLLQAGTEEDHERAADLMWRHRDDPVFAATLLHGIGPSGLVALLHRADRRWSQGLSIDRRLVGGMAAALAVAMRVGISPFGWRTLAAEGSRSPTGSRVVGLLFTTPAVFPTAALVGAARHLVVPWNRTAGPGSRLIAGPRGHIDVRTIVLRKIAADPDASRTVVATTDLDDLVAADLGYADLGLAVAEVLVSATAPVDPVGGRLITEPLVTGQRSARVTSAANLTKLVDWMYGSGRAPVGVEMSVDRLLGPWVGSLRSGGLDEGVTRHVALDEEAVRGVLGAGMRFRGVRDRLSAAAWSWAGRESRRLATGPISGVGFDAIGSVVGIVSVEAQNGWARDAARRDLERDRQRSLWSLVQGQAVKPLPPPGRAVVGVLGRPTRDELLPDTDLELTHWREHRDLRLGHEALALESLVVATLWDHRADNGYFEGPDRLPPPSLTIDRGDGPELRPLATLGPDEVVDYLRWRSLLTDGRPAPVQLAAERFLAEGRESATG